MLFNIGSGEILIIALVTLIIVGPEQLPSVMGKIGRSLSQAKKLSANVRNEFMSTFNLEEEQGTDQPSSSPGAVSPKFDESEDPNTVKNSTPKAGSEQEIADPAEGAPPVAVAKEEVEPSNSDTSATQEVPEVEAEVEAPKPKKKGPDPIANGLP